MVKLRNLISVFLTMLFLTRCNTTHNSDSIIQILSPSANTQLENLVIGEWKYVSSIWYSSELTLNDNGTFKFHDQGCYGQKFSEGEWTINNEKIFLTSFDGFKQIEQLKTNKLNENAEVTKPNRSLKNCEDEYAFVRIKNIPPPTLPGPNDTVRIYLDKIQLQLRNDTLYCVSSDKLPEEAIFHRTKNNR